MSDLYLMKEVIILKEKKVAMKDSVPPFFNDFSLSMNRKKHVALRAMRKKLNIFILQLPIYYTLE